MSMRIGTQAADAGTVNNARSAETKAAGPASSTGHIPVSSLGTDEVSLSSASSLVSLAKTQIPAHQHAKIAALTSQVRSGQYRADAAQVTRSMIQDHFKM